MHCEMHRRPPQVLATSHSAELLDDKDLPEDSLLAVIAEASETRTDRWIELGRENSCASGCALRVSCCA